MVARPRIDDLQRLGGRGLLSASASSTHLRVTGVIVGRDRLFEPGNVVGLELLGKLDGSGNLKRAVRRCGENRSVSYTRAII
jgi:hypothetical protein